MSHANNNKNNQTSGRSSNNDTGDQLHNANQYGSSQYPQMYLNNQSQQQYYNQYQQNYWSQYYQYQQQYNYYHPMSHQNPRTNYQQQQQPPNNVVNSIGQSNFSQIQMQNINMNNDNQQQLINANRCFNNNNNNNNNMNGQRFQKRTFEHKNNGNHFHQRNNHNSKNNNNANRNNGNKKQKIDKRDLPENNKFYCEACDRGFKTEEKYKEHCDTHQTCGINGCKFMAAAKLVEIHFRNFHATGLDKKVCGLVEIKTSDEIQKYINERKKNFPSASNSEKRSQFQMELESRGVRLNTQKYGKLNHANNNKRLISRPGNNKDDGDEKQDEKENRENGQEMNNVTSSKAKQRQKKRLFRKNKKNNKNKKMSLFERKADILKNKYSKPTLLQRLLADDIRHERNILLQCVKYIVENNFFEKSTSTSQSESINESMI